MKIRGDLLESLIANAPVDDRPTQLAVNILFNGALLIQHQDLVYRK